MSVVCVQAPQYSDSMRADNTNRGNDTVEIMELGRDPAPRGPKLEPQRDVYMTPYERLTFDLSNDKKALREVMLGKRIAFYRIRGELGSGNFSQVKLGVHILTREKVAIKILDKTKLDAKTQRLLSREITSMERLHHPNVVRLYEVVETLAKLYLIIEYASDGELFTRISNEGRIQEADARHIFTQIISAVAHMHDHNIVHRDLKAENIYFSGSRTVKVGDFGFSTRVSHQAQPLNTFCGSPPYAAPELFRDDSYAGPKVDVWALGIILYFVVSGVLPFRADTVGKLKKCILEGQYTLPPYLTDSCRALITLLLSPEASSRPTTREIVEHSWMEGEELSNEMEPFGLYNPPPDPIWDSRSSRDGSWTSPTLSPNGHVTRAKPLSDDDVADLRMDSGMGRSSAVDMTDENIRRISVQTSYDNTVDNDTVYKTDRELGSSSEVRLPLQTMNGSPERTVNERVKYNSTRRASLDGVGNSSTGYAHVGSPNHAQTSTGQGRPATPHSLARNRIHSASSYVQRKAALRSASRTSLKHRNLNGLVEINTQVGLEATLQPCDTVSDRSTVPNSRERRKSQARSISKRRKNSKFVEDELEARKICVELGITANHLAQAASKGLRSSVTGTYHIILHRLQKRHTETENIDRVNPVASSSSGKASDGVDRSSNGRKGSKEATSQGRNNAGAQNQKQSKTCVIL